MSQFIMPYFLDFLKSVFSKSDDASRGIDFIKKNIRDEVLAIAGKLFLGLILSSVMIFSLITMGRRLDAYLDMYVDGLLGSILIFSLIGLICAGCLYRIFRTNTEKQSAEVKVSFPSANIDFEKLLVSFLDGMLSGFDEKAKVLNTFKEKTWELSLAEQKMLEETTFVN